MKNLIIDHIPFSITPQMITESEEKNNGRLIVTGVLQRAGAKNQNGRVYPRPILEREVAKYKKTEIAQNRALGELDHPDSSVVNLQNVSHNVLDCWWKGDDVMGKVEILNTPAGKILKELLKAGILLGISSRGLGSVTQLGEDTVKVGQDFELICWDFVSNPSTHGAFMREVVSESLIKKTAPNYIRINNIITEILCETTGKCELPKSNCGCGCGGAGKCGDK